MKTICVDSGFLIALYDESDQYHHIATGYFDDFFSNQSNRLLIPWPILYESIGTAMTKNKKKMEALKKDWESLRRKNCLDFLYDAEYREQAMEGCLDEVRKMKDRYRSLSLTDRVIRAILSEVNIKIDYFITFNEGDFSDICRKHNRYMIGKDGF